MTKSRPAWVCEQRGQGVRAPRGAELVRIKARVGEGSVTGRQGQGRGQIQQGLEGQGTGSET